MSDSSGEKAKREALRILEQFLGIQPDVAGLLEIVANTLGAARMDRCLVLVRESRLTRRSNELASLAALIVATGCREIPGPKRQQRRPAARGPGESR